MTLTASCEVHRGPPRAGCCLPARLPNAQVLTVPVNPRVSTVRVCRRVGLPVESMDGSIR